MNRLIITLIACMLCCLALRASAQQATPKPPYERLLKGEDAKKAAKLEKRIEEQEAADDYAGAIRSAEELLALRTQVQGADHWESVKAQWQVDEERKVAALPAERRAGWRKAIEGAREAGQLLAKGQPAKAQPLWEEYSRWCELVFGQNHPCTAISYNNLAATLDDQGKFGDAQPLHQKSLDLSRKLMGEKHPVTAYSIISLGLNLHSQGKFAEAQSLFQKSLDLRRELHGEKDPIIASDLNNLALTFSARKKSTLTLTLFTGGPLTFAENFWGERHSDTAISFSNLAVNLDDQEKYSDAQPLYQKALDVRLELLGEKHIDTVRSYSRLASNLHSQKKYEDAQLLFQKALDLRRNLLGEKHLDIAIDYENLAVNLNSQKKYADAQPHYQKALDLRVELLGEKHTDTVSSYYNLAFNLTDQGKHSEAQAFYQKALDLRRELIGERHTDTVRSYRRLATNLNFQGKYSEAQPLYQKALDVCGELFGEKHPETAISYTSLAINLSDQRMYAVAQPLFQKALDLRRELLGEMHTDTVRSYNSLASNLSEQGKFCDAYPLYEKALALRRERLGERDPDTVTSYSNLANVLHDQGKYAEAQSVYERVLVLRREVLGEKDASTANAYSNLANNLVSQARYADALVLHQKALDLRLELFGQKHSETATSYANVAMALTHQRSFTEGRAILEKALDLRREILGERHPDTAHNYHNLAYNLYAQGKYVDAQPLCQNALDLHRELFGEQHPNTAGSYNNLALNLYAQGEYAKAQETLTRAIHSFESSRLAGASGLERATLTTFSSRLLLATLLTKSDPEAAWSLTELTLARGLLDQLAGSKTASLTPMEQVEQTLLRNELAGLHEQVLSHLANSQTTKTATTRLDELIRKRQQAEERLAALAVRISQREVAPADAIRAAIPEGTALVFWVDVTDKPRQVQVHLACVVRSGEQPKWEPLPGTGTDQRWSQADLDLPANLRAALGGNGKAGEIATLSRQLHVQRIAPLVKHLAGVRTLYVVPVSAMAGIPIEVLTTDYTISYVPSGTFLARLKEQAKPAGDALLAVADPIFADQDDKPKVPASLPPSGLLITQVVPGGGAARAQIKAGDVLLRYGETELTNADKLKEAVAANADAKTIPVTVWREDAEKPLVRDLVPGKLGVVLAEEPAPVAIANRRKGDAMLLAVRGGDWGVLPGTRVEASRIGQLFGTNATVLADSAASEQKLEAMRQSGDLKKYCYLHFATHGEGNDVRAFESALILAQDKLPKDPLPRAGEPFVNGQLSASEILEFWKLDAELVTLSACETAVGSEGGGDGSLGFAQAFLTAGSRAVCLSLWKVDDTATTLLMDRFYQNLLGKRRGLEKPMGKAAALAEAKIWLRNLTSEEALKLTADMTKGVVRGKGQKALTVIAVPRPKDSTAAEGFMPYSHPKYWAAFILIGDPD